MLRFALALLFAVASPLGLEVDPGRETFAATLRVPSASAAGDFQGSVALYGSRAEIPVAAVRISKAGAPLALRATIRYADIPADWATRFRADGFDYRLRGTLGSTPVEWAGRLAWEDIPVTGDETIISRFLAFEGVDLTAMQTNGSRGVARVRVTNPFAFPLQIAQSEYRIEADGRSFVYATDVELTAAKLSEDAMTGMRDADAMAFDAQYTPEEYAGQGCAAKRGWGHSTMVDAAQVARATGVKRLFLFHHDPGHSDEKVEEMAELARAHFSACEPAREGQRIVLAAALPFSTEAV